MNLDRYHPRILTLIPLDPAGIQKLQESGDVDVRTQLSEQELEKIIGEYNALIVSSDTPVHGRTIEYAYQLQVIGVAGAALDHINVSAARAQGVEIVNVPNRRTLAIAEQTIGLMLTLAHRYNAVGLAGKTLGIVGFGAVGHEVARRGRAFDMRVLVNQPRLTPQLALDVGIESRDLAVLLAEADFICLHLPSTKLTQHLIGNSELSNCKPGSFLINAGNPQAVEPSALIEALAIGRLTGAALVVPPGWKIENFTITHPHLILQEFLGPSKTEVERDIAVNLAEQLIDRLQSRGASNPLSLRVVPLEQVIPHEHFDPQRVNDLATRLQDEKTLVNPPVVVEWENHYIVLDGATRTTALKQLRYPHVIVQIVPPEDKGLLLHTWYHAVSGIAPDELFNHLQNSNHYSLVPVLPEVLSSPIDRSLALCGLRIPGKGDFLVSAPTGSDPLTALNALVHDYTQIGKITRTLNTDLNEMVAEVPGLAALVIFPQFTLEDVLQAAVDGQLLPAGITRFVIPGRILRLHAELERLRAQESLARKNAWLDRMLADKLARRNVRFYQEPVILLDE